MVSMDIRAISCCLALLLWGCETPYASFEEGDRAIYVCAQDGDAIVTGRSCETRSQDHLLLKEGGVAGGMTLLVDLCDSYRVEAFGRFEVVGAPPFDYRLHPWSDYRSQIDSLRKAYNNKDCRYIYEE